MAMINTMIPKDVFVYILSFLSLPEDLGRCQRVNKIWKEVINSYLELWEKLLATINPRLVHSRDPKKDLILIVTNRHENIHPAIKRMQELKQPYWSWRTYHRGPFSNYKM